jgi:hypothetical protein
MGVRQGDPLSPTLFILFINMFLKAMETIAKPYMWSHSPNKLAAFLLAYADDIAFYAENRDNLKLLVDKFDKFLTFYGFQIGHDKSAYQHINAPNDNAKGESLTIQGTEIPHLKPEQAYKYLGYETSLALKWKVHHESIVKRCKDRINRLGALRFPAPVIASIINATVFPIITYACIARFSHTDLEKIQTAAQACVRKAL